MQDANHLCELRGPNYLRQTDRTGSGNHILSLMRSRPVTIWHLIHRFISLDLRNNAAVGGEVIQRQTTNEIHQNSMNANTLHIVIKGNGIHSFVVIGINFLLPNLQDAIDTR